MKVKIVVTAVTNAAHHGFTWSYDKDGPSATYEFNWDHLSLTEAVFECVKAHVQLPENAHIVQYHTNYMIQGGEENKPLYWIEGDDELY